MKLWGLRRFIVLGLLLAPSLARAQAGGAKFGQVIPAGGTPSDIVLDELRGRLYLVRDRADRVDFYGINEKAIIRSVEVGKNPLAAAMSMDGAFLYVTNSESSSLSVIDLANGQVALNIGLPSKPEGVEVGIDGRAVVAMQGMVVQGIPQGTLGVVDRTQVQGQQVQLVPMPALPSTPVGLPPTPLPRPQTTFTSKLLRTPDGRFIVGAVTPNLTTTYLFVYEAASGVVLRNRLVTGESTVLSMSPDGSRFMAGFTLYDTATLAAVGQQSNANTPFTLPPLNLRQNIGGSAFSPDGNTLYSAFNSAPNVLPPPPPQASTLLISDPRNLSIRLGIKLPESVVAKMVIGSDGANAWGLSESGVIYLPLSTLYDYPILQPETTQVFLAQDECNRGVATATLKVNNIGKGKLTYSVISPTPALVASMSTGVAPSTVAFSMEPGRSGVNRRPGTNIFTITGSVPGGTGPGTGYPINLVLASPDAINIPNTVRVYMNYREPDQRGVVYPVPTTPFNSPPAGIGQAGAHEGLWDILLDEQRGRVYIANSGYDRLEVFDIKRLRFLDPIPVGQLPHQMALATDGKIMYVANTGGESISIVDLDLGKVIGQVEFPPIPRQGNAPPANPRVLAMGLYGLQFILSGPANGTLWRVIGNQALPRPPSSIIPAAGLFGSPNFNMISSPGSEYIVTMANGQVFLYDARLDTYTTERRLFGVPPNPINGYYGLLGAAPNGAFFLANGLVLNSSLAVIGGAERPVGPGQRNVAGFAALGERSYLRMTTPVRANLTMATRDDERATLDIVDVETGNLSLVGVAPENPVVTVLGTMPPRTNVPTRQMVVDSKGTAYAISLSGLSVIPTTPALTNTRPETRAIVNASDGTQNIAVGSFVTVSGDNLASAAKAETIPLPTVLGGSCITFNGVAIPLLETSTGQILGQVPETITPGLNVMQVRSLWMAQGSDPVVINVRRPAGDESQ